MALLKQALEDEDYVQTKAIFHSTIEALGRSEQDARFVVEKEVAPLLSKKPAIRAYLDYLALVFEDILRLRSSSKIHLESLRDLIETLEKKFPNASEDLSDLLTLRNEVELNINPTLLLTHFLFLLYHRKKDRA